MSINITNIIDIHKQIKEKKISISSLIKQVFDNIKSNNINAYISLFEDEALKKAGKLDTELSYKTEEEIKNLPYLYGIPIAIKDIFCMKEGNTTGASKILENYISPIEASMVTNMLNEKAIIIGKANMDEHAMGSSNETSYFGNVKNPLDLSRSAGGSSGGSAAAVASNQALCSLGSDTGGSVRLPASYTGLVGSRPTHGSCSRYGMLEFANSFDQPGPITKTVKDNAILLNYMYKYDEKDARSVKTDKECFLKNIDQSIQNNTIGIPIHLMKNLPEHTQKAWQKSIDILKKEGCIIKEIELPMIDYLISIYYILTSAEASTSLSKYDGIRYGYRHESNNLEDLYTLSRGEGFGEEVKRRILLGTFVLSASEIKSYYIKAQSIREKIKKQTDDIFKIYDAICLPTYTCHAPKSFANKDNPTKEYTNDIFTVFAAIAGIPAISLPMGEHNKLPLGVQIMTNKFEEAKMFNIAQKIENAKTWNGGII